MTTVLWIIAAIVIVNILLVTFWYFFREKKEEPSVEQPSEPVDEHDPVVDPPSFEESQGEIKPTEPTIEPPVDEPVEPKFKVGDWVVYNGVLSDHKDHLLQIKTIDSNRYEFTDGSTLVASDSDMCLRRWTIQDAKDGDVLLTKECEEPKIVFILKGNVPKNCVCGYYCYYNIMYPHFATDKEEGCLAPECKDLIPATKEQRDLLFSKMTEAGYQWDAETKTLSKIEEPQEPQANEPEPVVEEPKDEEPDKWFKLIINYFSSVVKIEEGSKTYQYLKERCDEAEAQFLDSELEFGEPELLRKELFPTVYDYYKDMMDAKNFPFERLSAWLFGLMLAELVPEKREDIIQMSYDYPSTGKDMPTYGYALDDDPNVMRMIASAIYASTRDASVITELRKEVAGKMLTYKNDISECYIDTTKFMPTAPAPYLSQYSKRPNGTPVDGENTAYIDEQIHQYISQYYNLDTKDAEKRQATIQAISNKEYHKQHLFGKPRTVTDKKYGQMTFNPVFGKHNLGIEIPDNGDIANFVYEFGKVCSATRITLLDQEYGRRRPGQGDKDGSANADSKQRALVNYAIEEGDGHTTGYYDKGGYYVDGNGNYVGDYETYYQGQLYANSYPSGHSAYIEGVGLMLMMVMPDKADLILKATNEFAISRCICRYHWMSDTIHGRVIGSTMVPVLAATTNTNFDDLLNKAKEEYQRILSGDVTPEPTPTPTEKVNTSLAYFIGGYGSCHVDAGETSMTHCCTKQCTKERHPAIQVNQRVNFTIEGGVTDDNGKTSGVWEANKAYGIKCPAVKEDQIATITMWNDGGKRVLKYRLSKDGTHDDGAGEI